MKCAHKSDKTYQKCRGFTLIELLVVVAIIAVLIAILLPALQNARANARTVACLANYHQFAIAVRSYMNDNSDWLPMPIELDPNGSVKAYWPNFMAPYIGSEKVLKCPAAIGELDPRWGHEIGGYGMNCFWIDVNHGPKGGYIDNLDYNPSIVDVPSKEVVFCDNRGEVMVGPLLDVYPAYIHPDFWGSDDLNAERPRLAARHSRSPNIIFLDLHAEHISYTLAMEWSEFWKSNPWWGAPDCWRPDWNSYLGW
jgi:prepilin-type N-terminal cleavage/methylation domain-containing protein